MQHINMPLVSYIIPFYAHNEFIFQCVESIVNDSYPNKEVIIIDERATV